MNNNGFIKIDRSIIDSWIFKNPLYFHWFTYIILKANFKNNNKFMFNGNFMTVKRGELITSIRNLTKELPGASEQKVKTFLNILEKSETINKIPTQGATHISILNYDSYQGKQPANNKPVTRRQPASNQRVTTIEEREEGIKNEKNIYRKFLHLSLSIEDFDKLIKDGYSKKQIDDILDRIENYKLNINYKSLYLTSKNWLSKEDKKGINRKKILAH